MKHAVALVSLLVALVSCATTPPIPPFTGPSAIIKDSFSNLTGTTKADLFYLDAIDGKSVRNAFDETFQLNYGHGMVLKPHAYERSVPAREAKYQLHGRTYFAAPILEMAGHAFQIEGEVVLTPEAGETYVVKGELSADHSAIWVENEKTGAQLGNRLLIAGSAEVKMFMKSPPVQQLPPSP
ncbi:MAG TPA: hypothetical protein VKC11_10790 [Steroidobacteraceae bacterium]|nr:hypothetical protein [Steroidobacteraceae bacterium]